MEMSPDSTLFYSPNTTHLWDTWIYYHEGRYHLYYIVMDQMGWWAGVGMAVSDDGVHWEEIGRIIEKPETGVESVGAGMVWAVHDETGKQKFMMSHSEFRLPEGEKSSNVIPPDLKRRMTLPDHMVFFESDDLFTWTRLPEEYESLPDPRWYAPDGRWDNLWPLPREGGGFYGYWKAAPADGSAGIGFGESDDGIIWRALKPATLSGSPFSTEVSGAYVHKGKYYAMVHGGTVLDFSPEEIADKSKINWDDHIGDLSQIGLMVADAPTGPFKAAPKNRRFLVGNASYFTRFVDTPDGVLVCHHSWELDETQYRDTDIDSISLAPLKRAHWDVEGTLRMKYWEGNDKAKVKRVRLNKVFSETAFNPEEMLMLEGDMPLSASSPAGLYLHGANEKGTGFLVHASGLVEYGDINRDGSDFKKKGYVDRELTFGETAEFRLIRKGCMTEFYINDYLMQCYSLAELGTGRISFIGPTDQFAKLKAWYCG